MKEAAFIFLINHFLGKCLPPVTILTPAFQLGHAALSIRIVERVCVLVCVRFWVKQYANLRRGVEGFAV